MILKPRIEGSLTSAVGARTAQCPDPWSSQGDFGGLGKPADSAAGPASFTVQLHNGSTLMAATQQEPVQDWQGLPQLPQSTVHTEEPPEQSTPQLQTHCKGAAPGVTVWLRPDPGPEAAVIA
jgi:hypothetical protein